MKHIVQFTVTKEQGVYTAEGVNLPVVTEGNTFEELQTNIREAVALYFEDENAASLGFSTSPAILTNFELSPALYEGSA
jgi:predicted RNase H-like HicB family nuclease